MTRILQRRACAALPARRYPLSVARAFSFGTAAQTAGIRPHNNQNEVDDAFYRGGRNGR